MIHLKGFINSERNIGKPDYNMITMTISLHLVDNFEGKRGLMQEEFVSIEEIYLFVFG